MSDWDVLQGQQWMLFHVKTGLFAGVPQVTDKLVIPVVSDSNQFQLFSIEKLPRYDASSLTITTDSIFHIVFNIGSKKYYLRSPIYSSWEIASGPPVAITATTYVSGSNEPPLTVEWTFEIASKEQRDRNDTTLHYGMPIYLMRREQRRYLRLDNRQQFLAIYRVPVTEEEMDPWILIPSFPVHSCFDYRSQECHSLSGIAVSSAMMTCKYNNTTNDIECQDDGGHRMFRTTAQCADYCRISGYKCSGPPLYHCEHFLPPADKSIPWQDFDDCIAQCISPQIQSLYPTGDRKAYSSSSPARSTVAVYTTINKRTWIVTVLIFLTGLGALIYFIYLVARRK